jgi:cleavage and polyadenylation specificity factor subunit 1
VLAADCAHSSKRLFVKDPLTKLSFLIDTGADVSVIPPTRKHLPVDREVQLFAANGTTINTYGMKDLAISLGLCRSFRWRFIVAEVKYPVLGADFLNKHGIMPDIKNRRILD